MSLGAAGCCWFVLNFCGCVGRVCLGLVFVWFCGVYGGFLWVLILRWWFFRLSVFSIWWLFVWVGDLLFWL